MSMNFNRLSTDDKILIMEGAQVLGDVVAGEGTAFWYNSVCRGEMQSVRIGKRCNIQDLALIHNKVTIGDDVSVGHCATVHGATIGDLDAATLFYFESRGIDRAAAQAILSRAAIERLIRMADDEAFAAAATAALDAVLGEKGGEDA